MTMPRIEGYAPDRTCRRCEHLDNSGVNHSLGCGLGEARAQEEHFPYVQSCSKFSDWYSRMAEDMIAIASEFTDNPAEAVDDFLMDGIKGGDRS